MNKLKNAIALNACLMTTAPAVIQWNQQMIMKNGL